MQGPCANFGIIGLQNDAALARPIVRKGENNILEAGHFASGKRSRARRFARDSLRSNNLGHDEVCIKPKRPRLQQARPLLAQKKAGTSLFFQA